MPHQLFEVKIYNPAKTKEKAINPTCSHRTQISKENFCTRKLSMPECDNCSIAYASCQTSNWTMKNHDCLFSQWGVGNFPRTESVQVQQGYIYNYLISHMLPKLLDSSILLYQRWKWAIKVASEILDDQNIILIITMIQVINAQNHQKILPKWTTKSEHNKDSNYTKNMNTTMTVIILQNLNSTMTSIQILQWQ